MKTVLLVAVLFAGRLLCAQDVDTIVLKNDDKKFTIVSQIQDPAEAAAFLAAINAKEPAQRHELAKAFLAKYPQSWLLPQAYDVSARSAIDLDKFDDALEDGRFSLRLLPENPSLLVLMANVEAQKNLFDRAMHDSSDALEYLSQIERPPNMSQSEWTAIRPQLESSAYFARARVETARGLVERQDTTLEALRSALDDLNHAAAWNAEDAEVAYLRAIVELQLGQKPEAAADLTFVQDTASPLRDRAMKILKMLARQMPLKNLPARKIDASLRNQSAPQSDPEALSHGYAGPEACQGCHASEYSAWRKTGMARMLQPYKPQSIIGDFSAAAQFSEDPDAIRMGSEGRPYFEISTGDKWSRYYVDFTIGSKWQQGYATKLPDGRLQVLPIEYNLLQKKWINYWKVLDPPGSPRAIIRDFPKLTPATNYQQNCAICHTSQLKQDTAAADPLEHAAYLQPGIDCEMCHGPSAWHTKHPEDHPLDFRKVSNREGVRVCAQCHRQSAVRDMGQSGEMNYATKGSFVPASSLRPYDAFSRKAFYKDGRFRETTFIVEAFTRSACYLRGTAQCATCHSPHLDNFETNQTSLKYQSNPNEMCLTCHAEFRNRIAEHTRHAAGSEASQCITCHMPRIMNALMFKARSHQIEIPKADLTERFGQQESPNVCLSCHSEKPITWAKEQLAAWQR
jgi:tetratricopeptide (TPR) repeat protein